MPLQPTYIAGTKTGDAIDLCLGKQHYNPRTSRVLKLDPSSKPDDIKNYNPRTSRVLKPSIGNLPPDTFELQPTYIAGTKTQFLRLL